MITKENGKKEIEYEQAPSGSVYFYNYKEPLIPFTEGYGYLGALIFDATSDKIQCHFCGEWYASVGHHLHREHNMTATDYKRYVGLNKGTALINESYRANLIKNGLESRMHNLRVPRHVSDATKKKISESVKENRSEKQNTTGTCPLQLIDRLVLLSQKLGRTPTHKEVTFMEPLKKVYGTFKDACQIAGIEHRPTSITINKRKPEFSREDCVDFFRGFYDMNGRLPRTKDCVKNMVNSVSKYGRKGIIHDALSGDGKYRKAGRLRYSPENLLDFLRNFEKINNRKPSCSDCKRGLLPYFSRYTYHFGTWKNALKLAGIQ